MDKQFTFEHSTDKVDAQHIFQLTVECPEEKLRHCDKLNNLNDIEEKICPWMKQPLSQMTDKNNLRDFENVFETKVFKTSNSTNINKEADLNEGIMNVSSRIRTSDVKPNLDSTFNKLNITSNILLALKEKGWQWPSPIQDKTILKIVDGRNVIARAKNGTGKTGAYTIGILNMICIRKISKVIIMVPTRELALQTANVCISLAKYLVDVKVMVTTGGTSLAEDIYRLSQPINVIVGTPGRIYDLLHYKADILGNVEAIILDEADKLLSLDLEFIVEDIINRVPKCCQKLLFSATYPESVKKFTTKYLEVFDYCNVMNELILKGVTQYYVYMKENQKVSCLKVLMKDLEIQQSIIFCNSPKRVELLAKCITEFGFSTYYIHSKMNQEARNRVFHDFRAGFVTYLVSTDMMSRGIDVPTVNVVFNFDLPRFCESYLHRVGRCGRFGHLGIAINFITEDDKNRFQDFEKELDTKVFPITRVIDKRLYVSSYQTCTQFEDF